MAGSGRDDSAYCDFFANFVFTASKSAFLKSANLTSFQQFVKWPDQSEEVMAATGGPSSWGNQKAPTSKSCFCVTNWLCPAQTWRVKRTAKKINRLGRWPKPVWNTSQVTDEEKMKTRWSLLIAPEHRDWERKGNPRRDSAGLQHIFKNMGRPSCVPAAAETDEWRHKLEGRRDGADRERIEFCGIRFQRRLLMEDKTFIYVGRLC